MLAIGLGKVMRTIISDCQSTFIEGRNILDGEMVINETVDYAKKKGDPCMLLKVDFEKAYDSVSWEFLDYMLGRIGFSEKWRAWIKVCLSSTLVSVLVNGNPTKKFCVSKGLHQGNQWHHFCF